MRAFVAIELIEPIREALAALIADLRRTDAPVKWVAAENIHLTLKFLGEVADESVPKAVEILRGCVAGVTPFEVEVKGVGGFPNLKRPRVIFVGALDQPPTAAELARRLNEGMAALGIVPEDRPYQNHITLGRVRETRPMAHLMKRLESLQEKSFGSMTVGQITLMKSDLRPDGPIYTAVEKVDLK